MFKYLEDQFSYSRQCLDYPIQFNLVGTSIFLQLKAYMYAFLVTEYDLVTE